MAISSSSDITIHQRHVISADLMLLAAKTEFQAACWCACPARMDAARQRLLGIQDAWCDAQLAMTIDMIRNMGGVK